MNIDSTPSPDKHKAHRLLELDALRGFAALFVVLFHFTKNFTPSDRGFKDFGLQYGATGVELFFIISGFVIFMSISNLASGKQFVINRFARLYPTYWTCVIVTFLVITASQKLFFHHAPGKEQVVKFFANLTMLQFYFGIKDLDGPYWTLIVELVFYVFIWVLFVTKTIRHIEKICCVVLLFLLSTAIANPSFINVTKLFSLIPLLPFFSLFYSGIVFYKILHDKETFARYAILITCFVVQILEYSNRGFVDISRIEYSVILIIYYLLFLLFVKNKLGFLVNRQTVLLGSISYSLYLIHNYISTSFILPALVRRLHVPFLIAGPATLAFIIFLAWLITKYIDIPYRQRIRKLLLNLFKVTKEMKF